MGTCSIIKTQPTNESSCFKKHNQGNAAIAPEELQAEEIATLFYFVIQREIKDFCRCL